MAEKGTIKEGATKEDMEQHAQGLEGHEQGSSISGSEADCEQRGWIINGCYWCGADCCVNPGWAMAKCCSCGAWYVVSR